MPSTISSKADIINYLADDRRHRNYLEICTPTTGNVYAAVHREKFTTSHRLMYRCPADFRDGLPIDFRSPDLDIAACLAQIRAQDLRYQVILVDSWHEYDTSRRDLETALALLADRGTIIVHDCLPPRRGIAGPHFVDGEWCGVSYKAYLDFVLSRPELAYCTVDVDFGCGVIRRRADMPCSRSAPRLADRLMRWTGRPDQAAVRRAWCDLGDDFDAAFQLLHRRKHALLNLVSARQLPRRLG